MVLLVSRCCRMTRNATEFIGFGALLWTITFSPCAKSDSRGLTDRFLREAPPKWKEYEDYANGFQGMVNYKYTENDKLVDNWRYEIKQNLSCKLVSKRYIEVDPRSRIRKSTEKLQAYNPTYTFSLGRIAESNPWLISGCKQKTDANPADTERVMQDMEITSIYTLVSVQQALRLSDFVNRSSFHVLDAKSIQREGRELVQIAFDNNHPLTDNQRPFCAVQSGVLILDPVRSWYLVFADMQELWADVKGRCTIENTISKMDGDRPVPKKSAKTAILTRTNGKPLNSIITYEFDLTAPASLPEDKEFTLSAFGFPEPSFGSRWIPWDRWALISGIVLIALAFFFWRFAKRKKSVA